MDSRQLLDVSSLLLAIFQLHQRNQVFVHLGTFFHIKTVLMYIFLVKSFDISSICSVNVGLFCSTPAVALGRSVPRKLALDMLFTGDIISAESKDL